MMCFTARPILNIGSANIYTMRPRWSFVFVVDERINRGIRPYFMKALKNLLSTALANKPIMNKRDLWLLMRSSQSNPSRNR